jgi:predicted nucleic acid-binding protein
MPLIISNASPLIALSNINRLNLLKKLWKEIVIPDAVSRLLICFSSAFKCRANIDVGVRGGAYLI